MSVGVDLKKILNQSVNKKERLKKSGLPIGVSYGPYNSFKKIEEMVSKQNRDSVIYFIRCVPKNYQKNSNLQIERLNKITWKEAKNFYNNLSGDSDNYSVQLFEIWDAEYKGGIVINNGRVMVDLEKDDKFYSKKNEIKKIKGASLDVTGQETNQISLHFNYLNNPNAEEKEIMIKAIKYLNPNLKREKFEQLKVYADFYYSYEHGFKFFDYFEGKEVDDYTSFKKI